MTDPVPSKELMSHWHCPHHGGFDARVAVGCPECVREMREELKRLRTALRGIQSCSTCEACRGAATLALGGVDPYRGKTFVTKPAHEREPPHCSTCACGLTPEPAADLDDAQRWRTYLKCYDREEMVAAEWDGPPAITAFIDSLRVSQQTVGDQTSTNQKCPRCGYVTANVFDCPTCKNPMAPFGATQPPGAGQ